MRLIISFLLAGMMALSAGEPSDAALQFFRDLTKKPATAKEDHFALSPFCGPLKKTKIARHWQERATWLKANRYDITIVTESRDDDLAAVVVGASTGDNPEATAVLALGVVRKGETWKVAPVEGCFDNTGLGFEASIQARAAALENWMSREKITALSTLRSKVLEDFRRKMTEGVDLESLKVESPEEAVNRFLKAAFEGKVKTLLAWQGVLERDQLPERDWGRAIAATRAGMATNDDRSAWRLLKSNRVMKGIVQGSGDTEEASYLVSFLSSFRTDPENEELNGVRFELLMTEGGWRIRLPAFFANDFDELLSHRSAFRAEAEGFDKREAAKIGYGFERENDKFRSPDPGALLKAVVSDLEKGNLHSYLTKIYREELPFDEDEGENVRRARDRKLDARRLERYKESVLWWASILGRETTIEARVHKVYQEGDLALGLLIQDDSHRSWRPNRAMIWMAKEEDGWMVLANPTDLQTEEFDPGLDEIRIKLAAKFDEDDRTFDEQYLAELSKKLRTDDAKGKPVEKEEGLAIVKEWRALVRDGTMKALLEKSAVRKIPDKPLDLLETLGSVRHETTASEIPDQILGSKKAGRFLGVSMIIDKGAGVERDGPLMIVAPTKNGPRVLVDIELPLESNKGIAILNEKRLENLAKELSPEDLVAIKELHAWHQKLAQPVWDKWNQEQAGQAK